MRRSPSDTGGPAATLQRAVALHRQGAVGEAEAGYRRLLRDHPGEPGTSSMLGLLLVQAGRFDEALGVLDAAIARHPKVAELHSSRGLVLARLARPEAAEQAYRAAIAVRPDLADAHHNLAVTLLHLGRVDAALEACRRALQIKPDWPEALSNSGNVLRRAGRPREAAEAYGRALALRPAFLDARAGRAAALAELGQVELAVQDYRAARAAAPDEPRYALRLADLLVEGGHYDEARSLYEGALAHPAAGVEARLGLGQLAAIHGDFAGAAALYEQVLAADPDCVPALCWLAEARGAAAGAAIRDRLAQLADAPRVAAPERGRAHYALSRVHAAEDSHARAFQHLQRANAMQREDLRRRGHVFDAAANAALVDRLAAAFGADAFGRMAGWGDPSGRPVFIVGMPRSGTTLTEQILATHPLVHAGGERREIVRLVQQLPALCAAGSTAPAPYPECIAALDAATAGGLARAHVALLAALAPQALRVTDKQPLNFRQLGLIAVLFPGARIVHCRRDPVDTCFSCYWQSFEAPMPWTTDLDDLAAFHGQYARLMAHWRAVLPLPMLDFVYEDVVADLEGAVRRLLAFCDLPWEPRCLQFHETTRAVATASGRQVREALRPRTGQWRPYAAQLAPLLQGLGEAQRGA